MFFNRDLQNESKTLAKWLISIPSISGSRGESVIMQAIYDGLSGFPYFKEHSNNLHLIEHSDQKNHSIAALVRPDEQTAQTLVLCASIDTGGLDHYGLYKAQAFKSDELHELFRQKNLVSAISNTEHELLYGLGSYECKGGAACMIAVLKELSDHAAALDFNILFLCISRNSRRFSGMREMLPFIASLCAKEELSLYAALSTSPEQQLKTDADKLHLYTANYGLLEPSFFILGQRSGSGQAFSGFSPALIAAKIVETLELNPEPLRNLSSQPLTPQFLQLQGSQSGILHDDCLELSFKLSFADLNPDTLLDALKQICAQAIAQCAQLLDTRAQLHYYLKGQNFTPEIRDAEILSYADLLKRAASLYPGDLQSALNTLRHNCQKEGLSARESACCIIEKLNEFVKLPRPSVVIFMGPTYAPCQKLSPMRREDRDCLLQLNSVLSRLNSAYEYQIELQEWAEPSALNFLRPCAADSLNSLLQNENPLYQDELYALGCPGLTLSLKGGKLYQLEEHIDCTMFKLVPAFIFSLLNSLSRGKRAHSAKTAARADNELLQEPGDSLLKLESFATVANSTVAKPLTTDDQTSVPDPELKQDTKTNTTASQNEGTDEKVAYPEAKAADMATQEPVTPPGKFEEPEAKTVSPDKKPEAKSAT